MRKLKNRKKIVKMRVRPNTLLSWIIAISSIFGVIGFTIAILAGNDYVRAGAAVLLFFLGWVAAKFHSKL